MHDPGPQYRSYTLEQLLDAQRSIDAETYPENASALQAEIQRRREGGERESDEQTKPPKLRRPKKPRSSYSMVIKLSGVLVIPQPIGFTWIGLDAASRSLAYPLILIPIGLAGGVIGFGMITLAPWLARWFPIWIPVYLAGGFLAFYAGEGSILGAGLTVAFLGVWLVLLNGWIQADAREQQ